MRFRPLRSASGRLVFGLFVFACTSCGSQEKAQEPFNIVLVMVDTLRADHMSLYSHDRPTTPFIDQFARQATVFDRHYSQAGCTFPSVNSLLTSRSSEHFLRRADQLGMVIPEDTPSISEILLAAGYQTLAVSASVIVRKTPSFNPFAGFDRGFQSFDESCEEKSAYCVNEVFFQTLDTLQEPFFSYLHYLEPHAPYRPPKWYQKQWALTPQKKNWVRQGDGYKFAQRVYDGREIDPDGPEVAHLLALYDDEIRYFDSEFERLIQQLEQHGVMDRTIVVLVSDHGEEFLEHGAAGHCRDIAYDTVLRVPGVVRLPDQHPRAAASRGLRVNQETLNLDIAPTLLALVGLDREGMASEFEGADLSVFWPTGAHRHQKSEGPLHRTSTAAQGENRVLRVGPYKLIYNLESGKVELYNVDLDAGEQRDVSQREPKRLAAMVQALKRLLESGDLAAETQGAELVESTLKRMGYL